MDGWMDGWVDGWMGGWVDGWMDGWVDVWMDGWRARLPMLRYQGGDDLEYMSLSCEKL